jgi:hypothetical protein
MSCCERSRVLKENSVVFGVHVNPWRLKVDNTGAIAQGKGIDTTCQKVKHVATKYHLVRDKVNRGELVMEYISTDENAADHFTKPAVRAVCEMATKLMGMDISIYGCRELGGE